MKAIVDVSIKAADLGYAKCKADVLAVGMFSQAVQVCNLLQTAEHFDPVQM